MAVRRWTRYPLVAPVDLPPLRGTLRVGGGQHLGADAHADQQRVALGAPASRGVYTSPWPPRSRPRPPPTPGTPWQLCDLASATAPQPASQSRSHPGLSSTVASAPSALPAIAPPTGRLSAWLARDHRRSCGQGPAGASPVGGVEVGSCGRAACWPPTPKVLHAGWAHGCLHQGSSRPDGVRRSTRPAVSRRRRRPVPPGRRDLKRRRWRRGMGGAGITGCPRALALD
jgi:hypothetical protein